MVTWWTYCRDNSRKEEKVMVSKARRSEIIKSAWRKRKREGGIGTCHHCKRIVFVGGIRREGHLFHRTCYYSWKAKKGGS